MALKMTASDRIRQMNEKEFQSRRHSAIFVCLFGAQKRVRYTNVIPSSFARYRDLLLSLTVIMRPKRMHMTCFVMYFYSTNILDL